MRRFLPLAMTAALAAGGAVAAVRGPLASLEPGRWQVSRSATGANPVSLCVHDFAALAQWEHRTRQCRRTIVSQTASELVVRYTCGGGDFGQAKLTTLTPQPQDRVSGNSVGRAVQQRSFCTKIRNLRESLSPRLAVRGYSA